MLFWLPYADRRIALRPGGFRITPLWDVPNGQIRQDGMRLAMSVDDHCRIDKIVPRHFLRAVKVAGYCVTAAKDVFWGIVPELKPALQRTLADLPDGFAPPLALACHVAQSRFAPFDQPGSAQPATDVVLPKGMLTVFENVMRPKEWKAPPAQLRDQGATTAHTVRAAIMKAGPPPVRWPAPRTIASFARDAQPEDRDNPKRLQRGAKTDGQ